MKRITSIALLFLAMAYFPTALYSQDKHTSTDTKKTGSFELNTAGTTDPATARYLLMPSGPDNMVLHMSANKDFTVNARVVDSRGKELIRFNTATVMPRYVSSINISKLAPGNYFVEVLYGDKNEQSYRIPFTRE